VIDIVREENLLDRALESGNYFMARLRDLAVRQPAIANVRGQGLMIGFDLVPPTPEETAAVVNDFMFGCRMRGVHLTYGFGGVNFRIIPPLVITRSEIDFAVRVMEESLAAVLSETNSSKRGWPSNPYTRQMFEKHPLQRLMSFWWRSSPAELVEKSRAVMKERFWRDA
jgi:hypothetical protein